MANSIPPLDLVSMIPSSTPVEDTEVKAKSHGSRVTKTKTQPESSSSSPLAFSAPEHCSKDCTNCKNPDCTYIFKGIYPDNSLSKSSPEKPGSPKELKQCTFAKTSPRTTEFPFTYPEGFEWKPH